MGKLPDARQEKFCHEYVFSFGHGTQSAINAKYSKKTARSQASTLLTKLNIQQRIAELREEHHDVLMAPKSEVLQKLAAIARFDPRNMFDGQGKLKKIADLDSPEAFNLQEFEVLKGDDSITLKVKAGKDQMSAIEKVMRFYNAYEDHQRAGGGEVNIQITGKDAKL